MTDDIVERLRNGGARCGWGGDFADCPSTDDCDECACAREAADEIERLRNAITAWADAWDAADRGEERDDGVGVYKYTERQEVELRKAVGR